MLTQQPSLVPLLRHQANQERLKNQKVDYYHQVGRVAFTLAGSTMAATSLGSPVNVRCEGNFTVTFNNAALEKPTFTFGYELDGGSYVSPGAYPMVGVFVMGWQVDSSGAWGDLPGKAFPAYKGATMGIVATGQLNQMLWIHYSFVSRAQPYSNTPPDPVQSNTLSSTTTSTGSTL